MTRRIPITLVLLAAVLAGCGGSSSKPQATVKPASNAPLVAALGDSITAGSPLWDPDPENRLSLGSQADEQSQFEYWATAALHGRVQFRNCGIFGQRTDEIRGRLASCAAGAKTLIVQGGINDIAQGRPVPDAAADIDAMVTTGQQRGLKVVLVDVLPWNNGYPQAAPQIKDLNRRIAAIGRKRGVTVVPFFKTLQDPDHADLMRRDWTIDGDHPSVAGYKLLGEALSKAIVPPR